MPSIHVLASSASVSQEVWVCQYVFCFQYVLVLSLKFGLPLLGQLILARHTLEIRHFRLLYSIQSIHVYTPAISWSFNFPHSPYHLYHQNLIHAVRYCRYTVYIGFIRPLASKMPMFVPRSYSSSDFGFKSKPLAMASSGAPMLSWICSGVRVSPMLLRYSWRFTVKQRHADYAASASSQTRPHNLQLGYPPCLCESHPLLVWSFKKLIVLPTEQDQQEVPGSQGRSSQASDVASCPLLRRAPPVGPNIARCFNPKKHAHFMNLYHALSAKFLDTYDFAAAVSQCSRDIPWHWVSQRPQSPHHQMLNRPVHLPAHHLWHGASESEGMKSAKILEISRDRVSSVSFAYFHLLVSSQGL